jgi:hypothetical protein
MLANWTWKLKKYKIEATQSRMMSAGIEIGRKI